MKSFRLTYKETHKLTYIVDADSEEDAETIVNAIQENGGDADEVKVSSCVLLNCEEV